MMGNAFATGAGAIGHGMMGIGGFGIDMAKKAPGAVTAGSKVLGNSLATTGGGIRGAWNAVKDQGVVNAAKGGLSNMFSAADLASKEAVGKVKDFAGGVADNLGQKEQAAHDAVYRGLKDHSHPEEVKPVSPFDPDASAGFESLSDAGPAGGGITDPTLPSSEPSGEVFSGVSDPTPSVDNPALPNATGDTPKKFEGALSHKQNFQKSMHQMSYMNQQMQQAGQRMQGQSHIKGAEIDESDE